MGGDCCKSSDSAAYVSVGLGSGFADAEVDLLVFDRTPDPLDEDIAPAMRLYHPSKWRFGLVQHGSEVDGVNLRSLLKMSGLPKWQTAPLLHLCGKRLLS